MIIISYLDIGVCSSLVWSLTCGAIGPQHTPQLQRAGALAWQDTLILHTIEIPSALQLWDARRCQCENRPLPDKHALPPPAGMLHEVASKLVIHLVCRRAYGSGFEPWAQMLRIFSSLAYGCYLQRVHTS